MRFLLDIVDSIRANVGSDVVLGMRMSADEGEGVVDGIRLPYSEEIAKVLADTGEIDYISVTIGIRGTYVKDMSVRVGPAVPLAAAIRKASVLPVIAAQRINHPSLAETALASGAADMIGMAWAVIAAWQWAAKARDGRVEEIRPCIACIQVCRSGIMGCVHSPTAGRETVWGPGSLKPAPTRRKVVVVGEGPAGMVDVVRVLEPDSETEELLASASSAVVVDDGSGFWETCGAAEALGKRGLQVHFVSPAGMIAANLPTESIGPLTQRLRWLGVNLLPMHRVSSIEPGKVSVYDAVRVAATRILEEKELPADIVVYFCGKKVVEGHAEELKGKVPEVHMVGDCVSPRRINQAVLEAHRVGRSL
ncbi:MAG: hypothetical protein DRQ37_08380 [Gammaproteobacteria bacterium]|nr:MAG: hypothetical protein DRQ37_08380 [Gammaproteobacteria bacterium]